MAEIIEQVWTGGVRVKYIGKTRENGKRNAETFLTLQEA